MSTLSLEERVAALEAEVEQLKRQFTGQPLDDTPWWKKIVGTFKDDPEYEEAMRLGREWRESFRPRDDNDIET